MKSASSSISSQIMSAFQFLLARVTPEIGTRMNENASEDVGLLHERLKLVLDNLRSIERLWPRVLPHLPSDRKVRREVMRQHAALGKIRSHIERSIVVLDDCTEGEVRDVAEKSFRILYATAEVKLAAWFDALSSIDLSALPDPPSAIAMLFEAHALDHLDPGDASSGVSSAN